MSARTLAEAQAECRARGVDLRVSGRGMTACMDLLLPFCPNGVEADTTEQLPRCNGAGPSATKAKVLLEEAQARAGSSGPPWLLIGGGVAVLGLVAWWIVR